MDIIEEIQLDLKNKFNVELSEEEIEAIIQSQSRTTKWAIENGEDVMWIYFGKFKIKVGRKGALAKDETIRQRLIAPFVKNVGIKRIGIGVKKHIESNFGEDEPILKLDETI